MKPMKLLVFLHSGAIGSGSMCGIEYGYVIILSVYSMASTLPSIFHASAIFLTVYLAVQRFEFCSDIVEY